MKKLFFLAATAMLFAACTNEEGVTPQQTVTEQQGVGFDVYVPGSTQNTRSGRVNVITNSVLQQTGFGIFAYQTDNDGYPHNTTTTDYVPNYMWNQQVFYNSKASGWYYAPLKYWPNETKNDSQDPGATPNPAQMPNIPGSNIDKLSFFAYAPWVQANPTYGLAYTVNNNIEPADYNVGIGYITNYEGKLCKYLYNKSNDFWNAGNPYIYYTVADNPTYSVDLLWGVAPSGGLNYTDVSGEAVEVKEGKPLVNLTKPAVNTNLKFMFQHALARLGVKVVAAVDQVPAGGYFDYGNTKITIEEISIQGEFGKRGVLDLNNPTAFVADWHDVVKANTYANSIKLNTENKGLAEHLRYDPTLNSGGVTKQQKHTGVTTDLADAIQVSMIKDELNENYTRLVPKASLKYSPTTPYFANATNNATPTYASYVSGFAPADGLTYFYKFTTDNVSTNNEAFTVLDGTANNAVEDPDRLSVQYPNATVWEKDGKSIIYSFANTHIKKIDTEEKMKDYYNRKAYRLNGYTFTPTGQNPQIGDYVFAIDKDNDAVPTQVDKPTANVDLYQANPNYYMVIPTNYISDDEANRTLKVKITYYVSTEDGSLKGGIVYTKNEVEKTITLPHLKNGSAYNLKLILGLTSVKVEAEVTDWETTEGVVNLPQNTNE